MAITTAVTNSAKKEFLQGIHAAADIYKMALFTKEAILGANTEVYSGANEVTGTGYEAGGKELSGYAASLDAGTAILSFATPEWAVATITARGCVIYNSSRANKVLAVFDFGEDIATTRGTFRAPMPKATAAEGLIRIA